MATRGATMTASILLISMSAHNARAEPIPPQQEERLEIRWNEFPIRVRAGTLATLADTLAGRSVRLVDARVVGVFDPRVFLVESQTRLRPIVDRNRVLVFVEAGTLRVDPASLVASTVTVSGVARTLLGMQVSREVPWPKALTPDAVQRLDIRAAVLASSVRTPEGIDLIVPSPAGVPPAPAILARHMLDSR